jgi:hypothetical protein
VSCPGSGSGKSDDGDKAAAYGGCGPGIAADKVCAKKGIHCPIF